MTDTTVQIDSAAGLWIEALILGVLAVAPLDCAPLPLTICGPWHRAQADALFAASAHGSAIGWESNDCAFGWSE